MKLLYSSLSRLRGENKTWPSAEYARINITHSPSRRPLPHHASMKATQRKVTGQEQKQQNNEGCCSREWKIKLRYIFCFSFFFVSIQINPSLHPHLSLSLSLSFNPSLPSFPISLPPPFSHTGSQWYTPNTALSSFHSSPHSARPHIAADFSFARTSFKNAERDPVRHPFTTKTAPSFNLFLLIPASLFIQTLQTTQTESTTKSASPIK